MATVTPVVVSGEGYVRVEVNFQDFPHNRRCFIYRRIAGQTSQTKLRDGDAAWLSNGIAVAFDHEAPLDTPLTYRATSALNWNGDFEEGVAEWLNTASTGTIGTVTQSHDYYAPNTGVSSLKLTPSGVSVSRAVSEFIPATAGVSYSIAGRLMVPVYWGGGIGLQIHWYNGTTFLSASGTTSDLAPFPGNWDFYGFSATAPATTTQMRLVAAIAGNAPATVPLYADEVYVTTAGTTVSATTDVSVPSNGGGWWTDPLHPATKARLQVDLTFRECGDGSGQIAYLGVGEETFPADAATMAINNSPSPASSWNVRKTGRQAIQVATGSMADQDAVKALHASNAPLFLQLNAKYCEPDSYGLHGDLSVQRVTTVQTLPWRVLGSQFEKVPPPVGPGEGTLHTRYQDLNRYTTFAAATSAGVTWLDALQGELSL